MGDRRGSVIEICSMQLGRRCPFRCLQSSESPGVRSLKSGVLSPDCRLRNLYTCNKMYRESTMLGPAYKSEEHLLQSGISKVIKKQRRTTKGVFTSRRCSENNRISVLWDISSFFFICKHFLKFEGLLSGEVAFVI